MIQEKIITLRKQTPTPPNDWLYESTIQEVNKSTPNKDGTIQKVEQRNFVKSVYLGLDAELLKECTNAEKVKWEEEHKPLEPIEE